MTVFVSRVIYWNLWKKDFCFIRNLSRTDEESKMLSLCKMLEYPRSCLNSDLKIRFFFKRTTLKSLIKQILFYSPTSLLLLWWQSLHCFKAGFAQEYSTTEVHPESYYGASVIHLPLWADYGNIRVSGTPLSSWKGKLFCSIQPLILTIIVQPLIAEITAFHGKSWWPFP